MDFQLLQLDRLPWLWLGVLAAAMAVWGILSRRRRLRKLAEAHLLNRLAAPPGIARQIVRGSLIVLALVATLIALLDPRWGVEFQEARRRGLDVVIALDASRSMLAQDIQPNRLTQAKLMALDVVDRLGGERAAVVGFAGVSAVKCPLTLNYAALRTAINELSVMEGVRGGSSLSAAIDAAADAFIDDSPQSRAIVLITDGDDLDQSPVDIAKQLKDRNIKLFIVGLGDSADGARIPIEVNGQKRFLTDQGREVWSKMNPQILSAMALSAEGAFLPAGTKTIDLGQFYETRVAEIPSDELESSTIKQLIPRFQWFIAAAIAMLIMESLLSDRAGTAPRSPRATKRDPS